MKFDEIKVLVDRFKAIKNRAAFAREVEFPGGASMIYQNLKGLKPISIEGAIAYARGFSCSVEEISPSIAERLAKIPLKARSDEQCYGQNVILMPKKLDPKIEQVIVIMEATDSEGRAMALAAVKVALANYRPAKKNLAS